MAAAGAFGVEVNSGVAFSINGTGNATFAGAATVGGAFNVSNATDFGSFTSSIASPILVLNNTNSDSANVYLDFRNNGTTKSRIQKTTDHKLVFSTGGTSTALTLDNSQNATFAGAATVSGGLNVVGTNNTTSTLLLSNTAGTANNWSLVPAYNAQTLAIKADSTTVLTLNEDTSATFAGNINAVAGGINLGATGSANLLDDYEVGTWTPTVSYTGGSPSTGYSARIGNYVKVGDMVTANLYIVTNAHTAGTGNLQITGFPFRSRPDNTYHAGTIGYLKGIAGGATTNTIIPYLPGNGTIMYILSTNNSAVASVAFTSATHIILNITYQTA